MSDTLLASFLSTLDMVVFERLPNSVFMQVTPSPRWFMHAYGAESQGRSITLSQAFPFLETFLTDAEAFWLARRPEVLWSEPFTTSAPEGEGDVLLRAAAATVGRRPLLVLERLVGLADPRGLLQLAREKDLDHERVQKRLAAMKSVVDALRRAADDLVASGLRPAQEEVAHRVRVAADRVMELSGPAPGNTPPRPGGSLSSRPGER